MSFGSAGRPIHVDRQSLSDHVGTVVTSCGAVLSLLSFFAIPYVSFLSLSVTGAQLAGLSADVRQLIYGGSGGQWLLAWWLVPLTASSALFIAIGQMRSHAPQARKMLAAALIAIGVTVTVGLLATFSYLVSESNSDIASAVVGPGFWLTAIGMLAVAGGGVVSYNRRPCAAAEMATDQPRLRDRLAEALPPRASDKSATPSGSEYHDSQFGPYRLESLIGQGSMGQVYRAVDTVHERAVAIKLLAVQLAADPGFRARFQDESALAARLREPHIVPIHDYGEIDGRLYIDMRLVDGTDLARLLAEQGPLSPERAVNVVSQIASALDAAHTAGLAHRDIKPSNILVTGAGKESADEFVYVTDFGLARLTGESTSSLTMTGCTVGSLGYMAPERFTGGHGDHRVDIYSLGCLLFEVLTGRGPFLAEGLPSIIHAHLNQPPPRPSQDRPELPAGLDTVIARAMAKDPHDRYSSAGDLAVAARSAVSLLKQSQAVIGGPAVDAVPPSQQETVVPVRHPGWTGRDDQPAGHPRFAASTMHQSATAPRRHRHLPHPAWITVAVALVAAMIGGFIVLFGTGNVAADDIHTEPGPSAGANPFMPPAGDFHPGVTSPPGTAGTFAGSTSGLYGGTLNNSTCDRQAMINFLQAHPDKGAAWADVQGINQADLPGYISGLTPVLLRSDTAVTNHGFSDGHATTLNSVLQAGTAVLVDKYGVPRSRCYCGNPLTPASSPATKRYVGPTWSGFSPASITTIKPAAAEITEFTLVNPFTNDIIYRPAGTTGDQDRPKMPPPPSDPVTSTPPLPEAPQEPSPPAQPVQQPPQPAAPPAPALAQPPAQPAPAPGPAQPPAQAAPAPPTKPAHQPPKIVRVETYREGVLVYFSLHYTDPNDDADGFGFRGAHGSGWAEATFPFSSPSYGRVSPGRVDYPFNHACGTPSEYESDVEAWIYDSADLQSKSVIVHLSCRAPSR